MIYRYTREEFYNRTLFSFLKDDQPIVVAFEQDPNNENKFLVIIFSECGGNINNPHEIRFASTLDHITVVFAEGRDLLLEGAAI